MPKLVLLAACERVIIDRGGLPSLVNVFQRMNMQLVHPIQADSVVPNLWAVFTIWETEAADLNVDYIQHFDVVAPDEKIFIAGSVNMKMVDPEDYQLKSSLSIQGIPVSTEGLVTIHVWLEGYENEKHSYHFRVSHVPADPAPTPVTPAAVEQAAS